MLCICCLLVTCTYHFCLFCWQDSSFIGWEKRTSWWEAEAESGERETWAAIKSHELSTCLLPLPFWNSYSIWGSRPSCWEQTGALHGLPWSSNVAVHATNCGRYLRGSCSPPSGRLKFVRVAFFAWERSTSILSWSCKIRADSEWCWE